jgi:hypothetical protein
MVFFSRDLLQGHVREGRRLKINEMRVAPNLARFSLFSSEKYTALRLPDSGMPTPFAVIQQ